MMKQFKYKNYLRYFAFFTISLLIFVISFNWFINPYGIYNSPEIAGLNVPKTYMLDQLALAKAHAVTKVKPVAIILGTSRANQSINPDHPGWSYSPVYNLALPAASTYEMLRNFQHAHHVQPLKQTLLFVDFFIVDANRKVRSDFDEARFSVSYEGRKNIYPNISDSLIALLSLEAVHSSINTITHQMGTHPYIAKNGMWVRRHGALDNHRYFLENYNAWFNAWASQKYRLEEPNISGSPLDYYRQILQIAYRDNIDLRIATSPCHVLEWEPIAVLGLWPEYEQWKRKIVEINEEEARRAGKPPFQLWDFSLYNELTTETVPPLGDTETGMQWYVGSSHYTKEFGDLILNYIFNYQHDEQSIPDDLGVLLTSKNISDHLQKIRADRENYIQTYPDEIAEIAEQLDLYLQQYNAKEK